MVNFGEALTAVKAGSSVYRVAWRDIGYEPVLRLQKEPFALLVMDYPGRGPMSVFAGAQTDILAEDWEILD